MPRPALSREQTIVQQAAARAGIDPALLWGVFGAESNFGRNQSTSSAGAVGPFQLMPSTATSLGVDPRDMRQAADGAARYLARYRDRGAGGMLAAYNAGPAGNPENPETRAYVPRVLALAHQWNGSRASVPPSAIGGDSPAADGRTSAAPLDALATFLRRATPFAADPHAGRQAAAPLLTALDSAARQPDVLEQAHAGLARLAGGAIRRVPATGVAQFDGKPVAGWIVPILSWAREHGWTGTVTSGYRSFADQQRIYDSGVRPAAMPGTSNHEGTQFPRGAVDVSGAAQLGALLNRSPYAGRLVWAGAKDPVHLSHPHGGSY